MHLDRVSRSDYKRGLEQYMTPMNALAREFVMAASLQLQIPIVLVQLLVFRLGALVGFNTII